MLKRKKLNILLIIISVLLLLGIIAVYIIGEKRMNQEKNKKISGATEVITAQPVSKEQNEAGGRPEAETGEENNKVATGEKSQQNTSEKKNRFEGMPLKQNDKGVPVLMFHSIDKEVMSNGQLNELRVPVEAFREQMKYLKDNGYMTLTMDEAYKFFNNNEGVPEKSVVLTFDDGYLDNYTNALPVLKEFGFKATVFVISDVVDKGGQYMTSTQLKELEANGFEIQAHTVTHPRLSTLTYDKQLAELKQSKEFLERLLSKKIDYIAYPYGDYNENTLKATKEAGYTMAFTTNGTWSDKKDGIFTLDRVYISSLRDIENFKQRVSTPNYK